MKRIVITGGPYAGKTTLINHFAKLGYKTIPEVASKVINRLNRELGVEEQRTWRKAHVAEFQHMIFGAQENDYCLVDAEDEIVFYDRGLHAGLAYLSHYDQVIPERMKKLASEYSYDCVFLCHVLDSFDRRRSTGRISDKKAAVEIQNVLKEVYLEYGHEVIEVPQMPVEDRVNLILRHLRF